MRSIPCRICTCTCSLAARCRGPRVDEADGYSRGMDLFEYQGKQYFARFGIPVSPGGVADTVDEAVTQADRVGYPVVVKAQVQVGGRGKAGGIKLANNADEVRTHAANILGMDIKGHTVKRLWIERASDIAHEYYASFTLDRGARKHLGMVSAKGGIDIEQVAAEDPQAIARLHIDPVNGLSEAQARQLVSDARLDAQAQGGAVDILKKLYRCFVEGDADLVEINPLVLTPDGRVHALDAKVSLDNNADFRHPEWQEYRATEVLDERERLARSKGLQYIGLSGSVGIIANGAGLAMSIFVDDKTRVVYQGLTGSAGRFYGLRNRAYGTQVVAGTNPARGGTDVEGIPVFAAVKEAVEKAGATASCIFVPAPFVESAVLEAAEAGITFIAVITEGVPAQDEARFFNRLQEDFPNVRLLGPNCPGIITPGKCNIGITPGEIALPGGPVGVVSRSGTLTYQALYELTQKGIGQTTCVGIGGDPVPGTNFIDCLSRFEADPETKAVIMIGEIGGAEEEKAAEFIAKEMSTPVVAYVAGVTAPPGRKMGHAGAIISGSKGTAKAKMDALEAAGVRVAQNPTEAGELMAGVVAGL